MSTNTAIQDVEYLAHELFAKHDLLKEGWTFQIIDKRRPIGFCNHNKKQIAISAQFLQYNSFEQTKDVILHEIAHALVGYACKHGKIWKSKCIEIGAIPETYAQDVKMPPGKYTGTCPVCKKETQFYSKLRRSHGCGSCSNGKYEDKFKLEIKQNY